MSATRLKILTSRDHADDSSHGVVKLANDADPLTLEGQLGGIARIELDFPHFTDGRAYSQAYLLRRRLGFAGDLRATGDVLLDQLVQMARTGFSSAVLKDGSRSRRRQPAIRALSRFLSARCDWQRLRNARNAGAKNWGVLLSPDHAEASAPVLALTPHKQGRVRMRYAGSLSCSR